MHSHGEDFPWEDVDDKIIDYMKTQIENDEEIRLTDSGAPKEAIEIYERLCEQTFHDSNSMD